MLSRPEKAEAGLQVTAALQDVETVEKRAAGRNPNSRPRAPFSSARRQEGSSEGPRGSAGKPRPAVQPLSPPLRPPRWG